jgi:hypothetical protein
MSMLLTLHFACLTFFFFVSVSPCTALAFFPECLYNHCQGHCHTFSEICTTFVAVPLSDPLQNCFRPDIRLQIKGWKKSASICRLPRYDSTIIYRCIALLQLLYRWEHQSWKFFTFLHSIHKCSCRLSYALFSVTCSCVSYYFIHGHVGLLSIWDWPYDGCLLDSTPLFCFFFPITPSSPFHHHHQGFENIPAVKVIPESQNYILIIISFNI